MKITCIASHNFQPFVWRNEKIFFGFHFSFHCYFTWKGKAAIVIFVIYDLLSFTDWSSQYIWYLLFNISIITVELQKACKSQTEHFAKVFLALRIILNLSWACPLSWDSISVFFLQNVEPISLFNLLHLSGQWRKI